MPIPLCAAGLLAALALSPLNPQTPATKPSRVTIPAKNPAPPAPVKLPANVVARVNGRDISRDDLMNYLQVTGGRKLIQDMVQRVFLDQEAKKYGITLDPKEVTSKVDEEKAKVVRGVIQQSGQPVTFAGVTAKYGLTEGEIEWGVRLNLLAKKTFAKTLEKNVGSLAGQRKLAHILVATVDLNGAPPPVGGTPEEQKKREEEQKKREEDSKAKAEQLLADIRAEKMTFVDAAKKFSEDKGSGAQGGELPWSGRGVYVPEFEKAAFALAKAGDITEPVKSQFGWHIIKLVAKGEDATPAEKKKFRDDQIAAQVNNSQAFTAWLAGLSRSATITLNPSAVTATKASARPAAPGKSPR